jgi:hypothetical protein
MTSDDSAGNGRCGACAHFCNDPGRLEEAFAGLTSLSSAYGSTSADDGLCLLHDRYLTARSWCARFARPEGLEPAGGANEVDETRIIVIKV